MIDELRVHNVALIREARLRPAPGLTVLTGETGAGKSALLSSIKLLMGARADAGAVREGADALEVECRLFTQHGEPDGLVVRRRVGADGRGRVSIDDRMASVRELAQGPGATVDLCSQHEHQRLLQAATHVELLDAWGAATVEGPLERYRDALARSKKTEEELAHTEQTCREAAERLDEARFVLERIDEVSPREGELEELEAALPKAEHAESLMRAAAVAREALVGDDGALDLISEAIDELRGVSRHDAQLAEYAKALQSALIDVEDVASELRDYRDSVDLDAEGLDRMQRRMSQLRGLLRTYGPGMEDVMRRRTRAEEVVLAARDGSKLLERARAARDAAERDLLAAADTLDAARSELAPRFAELVSEQMGVLEMGTASLSVEMERLARSSWSKAGPSRVEFLYRPASGLTARPLRRIASGGEVSRVMLACKVVLGEADSTETLVFDEVDAGVGGATAVALAQVLARLATTHQVIVVTHLAQVAVHGQAHYLVRKSDVDGNGVPVTAIELLEGERRVEEIARMLSGDTGEASLAHAREMLVEQTTP